MLCARSCPDWCIYIEGHKEKRPPRREGGRDRTVSVLDRFDIDYALCMYCGICVEVCPFDALFWSPEFEYSESQHRQAAARQGQARRVDGDRPRARAARDRRRGARSSGRGRTSRSGSSRSRWPVAAIGVVRSQNVVHAALYLVVVLAGAAAQYILLGRRVRRLGAGAHLHRRDRHPVPVRDHAHPRADAPRGHASTTTSAGRPRSCRCSCSACSPRCSSTRSATRRSSSTNDLVLIGQHRATSATQHLPRLPRDPFEVVSMLLLAALVGAVVIARRD